MHDRVHTWVACRYFDTSPVGLDDAQAATYTDTLPLLVAMLEYINSDEGQARYAST